MCRKKLVMNPKLLEQMSAKTLGELTWSTKTYMPLCTKTPQDACAESADISFTVG